MKKISDNEIYLLITYITSVVWKVAKRLSYIKDARCLKVNMAVVKLEVCVTLTHSTKEPQDFCDYFKCKQSFKSIL